MSDLGLFREDKKMVRAALYARVSTAGQDPDNQVLRLTAVAQARGYDIQDVYTDVASGADARRPELDRMICVAQCGEIDRIMATKIDRLARSLVNLSTMMEQLTSWGVHVEFLDQPIDTSTSSGKFTLTVLAAVAEYEHELIHDRTMDGLARARSEGRTGGRPRRELTPYQKEKARKILAENPDIRPYTLAKQFDGIDSKLMVKLLREEGILLPAEVHE